LRTSESKGH